MSLPARRKATYQDLLEVPDHLVAEIIDGELYTSPRPAPRHANAASGIGGDLWGPFHRKPGDPNGPGGWWILDAPELHLGEDILVPDVAGWRRERLPTLPDKAFFSLAPDWVCEVPSPGTTRMDRIFKRRIYAREGVDYLWMVDPIARTREVSRRAGEVWQDAGLYAGEETIRAIPFDAIELDLSRWWA